MGQRVNAITRTAVAMTAGIALTFGAGGVVMAGRATAATSYVVTSGVNVRTAPSTSSKVIGTLQSGAKVSGTAVNKYWIAITYKGSAAYVSANYLKKSSTGTPTPAPSTGTKVTTTSVNLRTAPSLDSTIVKLLPAGTTVTTTGKTSGTFTQVTMGGTLYWLYTAYLGDPPSAVPAVKYQATTTATLAMRTAPEISAASTGDLKPGTTVALTGTHDESYSQIVYKGTVVWVLSGYLKTTADAPALPTSAGKRFANVDELNIRATSAADGKVIDTIDKGTVLLITGKTENKRSQVIFGGALRWAYSAYLATTRPSTTSPAPPSGSLGSTSLDRLNAYGKQIVREIRKEFPAITTMYGWRMSSAYSSDHPGGRAVDLMIPKYKTSAGKTLGDTIARYLQTHHKRLHVSYLIWRQRSWNVARSTNVTAWRAMSDRGGDTANHYDHVHVSVLAVK